MRIYYLLLLSLLFFSATAQEYIQTNYHYNLEKGLETRNIRSTFKDSRGFMWIATDVGAYRFDGFEFRPYKRNRKSNIPLSVERISEDADKNLWFQHYNYNKNIVDYSILPNNSDTIIAIEDYSNIKLPFPIADAYNNVSRTNNNKGIWLTSSKTKEIFELRNGQFEKIGKIPIDSSESISKNYFCIDKDSKGTNWLVYESSLYKEIPGVGFEFYEVLPTHLVEFKIDKQDRFWFNNALDLYTKENLNAPVIKPAFLKKLPLDKIVDFMVQSINGQFIVANLGNVNEMLVIDYLTGEMIQIQNPIEDKLVQITPSHVFIDEDNTIWVSTYQGVFQTNFRKNNFKKLMRGKSTRGIIRKENENLLVASYNGFFEINTESNEERLLAEELDDAQGAYLDSNDNYWFGGSVKSFHKISSLKPLEIKRYEVDAEYGTVYNFYQHKKDKRLWMGTEFGLFLYNEEKDKFFRYEKTNQFAEINQSSVINFEPIDDTNFLLATSIGIFQLDINKGIVNHFCSANNNFPYDYISHIHQDEKDQTFWVGTKMGGLIHWKFPSKKPKQITTNDGLADNTIYAIYEDKFNKDYLWLPSNNGLMHFNKATKETTNYKVKDGIVHNEFNFQSHFEDEDGTLYFGGIQGVTALHPKNFNVSKPRPKLHLTSVDYLEDKNNNSTTDLQAIREGTEISLGPRNKSVKLSAALTNYQNPTASKYYYKIGDDLLSRWLPMDGNSILINGLSIGKHNIYIKAKNAKGIWAQNEIVIPIKMLAPFYLRWWFFLGILCLLYVLVKLFIKRRTYVLEKDKRNLEQEVAKRTREIEKDKVLIEKQAEELQQLDEIKSRFFSNVTHELRTPLTLIIGPLQQLIKSENLESSKVRKTLQSVVENGNQLKALVEEILDLNRLDARKLVLNKEPVRLRNVIEKWINNFSPEAENRNIQFKLEYDAITNLYLNLDAHKLERIVTNLLSNAFKYSENGDTIYLRVVEQAEHIKIEVEDTGLGIHPEDQAHIFQRFYQTKQATGNLMGGLGIGLALSKELAELMKGVIQVKSELGVGSNFTFTLPKEKVEGIMTPFIQPKVSSPEKVKKIERVGSLKRRNVLIVEDNFKMQQFIQELLDPIANLYTANNGKEALAYLESKDSKVDIIVSDVMMPEMDGFTLLKLIKQQKKWQLTPFIFLTARADILDRIEAFTIGVDDYMVKPFEPDDLIARVRNLLVKIEQRSEFQLVEGVKVDVVETEENNKNKEFELINDFKESDSAEFRWLKEIEQIAINNAEHSDFNVAQLAFKAHLGERQLGRKLKQATGMTPGNYLKEVRLQKARHLLENKIYGTVSEVSYNVGFTTPEYFSRIFKKRFGKLPTEYIRNKQKK